jgi:hypothetical protein
MRRQCRAERRPPAFFAAKAPRSSSDRASPRKRSTAFFFSSFTHRYRSLLDLRCKSDRHPWAEGLVRLDQVLANEKVFSVVLTPSHDKHHRNHPHLDGAAYTVDGT